MNRGKPMKAKNAKNSPNAKNAKKKTATKSRPSTAIRRRARKPSAPAAPELLDEVREPAPDPHVSPEPPIALEPALAEPPMLEVPLTNPETIFAERVSPPELERPYPASRRAIFFDVENTSRAQHIARVIEHLQIDRRGRRTEFFAVGNWRVIGNDTARLLARHGAQLVHSAPSVGVRDWSDLRIAVAAGAWLASARPGDVIEIVSDDRAFDAVGDVASSLGITFHRLSYRALAGAPVEDVARAPEPPVSESRAPSAEGRGHRYRGRFRGRRDGRPAPSPRPTPAPAAAAPVVPAVAPVDAGPPEGEPHTAPHDEIIGVVQDLMRANPGRGVSIDAVANALKARGFSRPPGSPRLITRLRRIKEIEINRAGIITLASSVPAAPAAPEPSVESAEPAAEIPAIEPVAVQVDDDEEPQPGNRKVVEPEAEEAEIEEEEGPQPGNEKTPSRGAVTVDPAAQRRRRRGGRRWHGRGRPQPSAAS